MITPAYSPTATERVLPRLALDFTTGVLDPRVTVTRALDTATRVNSSGYIEIVNANLPRFDYDPVTLAPKGLLIEETRRNLLLRSQELDVSGTWGQNSVSVGQNATTSPDGTTNAESLIGTAANARHYLRQSQTVTSSTSYALTAYAKANGYTVFALREGNTTGAWAQFDVSAGTVRGSGNGGTGSIQSVGNGWYRCSLVCTTGAAQTSFAADLYLLSSAQAIVDPGNILWTPDGTSGLFVFGADLEAGTFATSYIPTSTAQVTRNADAVSMTGTNFSSWYNNTEGTFTASFDSANVSTQYASTAFTVFQSASNRYGIHVKPGGGGFSWYTYVGAVEQARINGGTVSANQVVKASATYKANSTNGAFNGTAGATDTSCTVTNMSALYLGAEATVNFLNGHIQKLAFYTPRLLNAELEAFSK